MELWIRMSRESTCFHQHSIHWCFHGLSLLSSILLLMISSFIWFQCFIFLWSCFWVLVILWDCAYQSFFFRNDQCFLNGLLLHFLWWLLEIDSPQLLLACEFCNLIIDCYFQINVLELVRLLHIDQKGSFLCMSSLAVVAFVLDMGFLIWLLFLIICIKCAPL